MFTAKEILDASLAEARTMIQENLRESDAWLYRGLLAIYDRQTFDEQNSESTQEFNGIGFNGADAQILSSFAKQIQAHKAGRSQYRDPLSPRQRTTARRLLHKYAGQLARVARERAAQTA